MAVCEALYRGVRGENLRRETMSNTKRSSQLRFPNSKALCAWLRQTQEGREVLAEVTAKPKRKARTPVLVVLHSDGWVEVFGIRKRINVKVVQRLHITDSSSAIDATIYTDILAGKIHSRVHWPKCLVATGQVERITAEQEYERLMDLWLLRAVRNHNRTIETRGKD